MGPWFWAPEWELKESAREALEWHHYELEEVFKVEWYAHPGQAYLSDVGARLRDGRYPKGPYGLEGEGYGRR